MFHSVLLGERYYRGSVCINPKIFPVSPAKDSLNYLLKNYENFLLLLFSETQNLTTFLLSVVLTSLHVRDSLPCIQMPQNM